MKKEKKVFLVAVISAILIIGINYTFSLTGFFAFQPDSIEWNFLNSQDYIFNSSEINFSASSIRLSRIAAYYQWSATNNYSSSLISAIRDGEHDDTSKVTNLDETFSSIDDDESLKIKFDHALANNDLIYIYLKNMAKEVNIYLCPVGIICNLTSNNYGYVTTDHTGDVSANIRITNLNPSIDEFDINANDTTKINYITSAYYVTTSYNATNYIYRNSSIETSDLDASSILRLGILAKNEELQGQIIDYKYSIDSGINWNSISDYNLSYVSLANGKIRLKAELYTNSSETPVLHSMSLNYYGNCIENWACSEWGSCENHIMTRNCIENNNCMEPENRPVESESCGNFIRTVIYDPIELSIITDINTSAIPIELSIDGNKSENNGLLNLENLELPLNSIIQDALINATLKYYYNETEMNGLNMDSSTLSFYHYNESSAAWESIDTIINYSGGYIQSNPIHFSKYGVFGEENNMPGNQQPAPPSSGGSGSSSKNPKSDSSSSKKTISEIDISKPKIESTKESSEKQDIKKDELKQDDEINKGLPELPATGKTVASNVKRSDMPSIIVLILIIGLIIYYVIKKTGNQKAFKFGKKSKKK